MSGFERMIAIPQEEYIQLKSVQHVKQPQAQKMVELSQLYQQQAEIKDPYEKLILQGNTLDEMKEWKDKIRNEMALGTPKPYRNRALSLYRSMEPHVKINQRGEIHDKNDKPIEHSRVEDLIQHAVRDRRRHFTPIAWDHFSKLLKEHNIPRSLLNRATLEELDKPPEKKEAPKKRATRKRQSLFPEMPITPKSAKRKRQSLFPEKQITPKSAKRKRRASLRYPSPDFLKDF